MRHALLRLAYGQPRSRGPFDAGAAKRILVIRRNGIGDMICALPLLRSVRAAFPAARIEVLASSANAAVARSARVADEVLVYPPRSGVHRNKYANLFRVARELRGRNYDLVVAVTGGHSTFLASIAYASGAPWRAGYVPARGERHFAYTLPVDPPPEDDHQVLRCLRLLLPLGAAAAAVDLSFDPGDAARSYAAKMTGGRFVLYNASATRRWNAWTAERIAALAAGLELDLIVSGVAADRALLEKLKRGVAAVVEPPTIHHFAALAERSVFVMSGDGGAVHVAAAMKKPTFVLYPRRGNPRLWAPYGVPHAFIRSSGDVADIAAADVLRELERWMESGKAEGWSG
jgi:heptosyltransferase III